MKKKKIVKIDVNMFENSKFKLIEKDEKRDMITVIWMKLLSEAGKTNDCGLIYLTKNRAYSLEMLSTIFNRATDDIKYALEVLMKLEMIRIYKDNIIEIINWCQYQEPKRKAKEKSTQENRVVTKDNSADIVQQKEIEKEEEIQPENLAETEEKSGDSKVEEKPTDSGTKSGNNIVKFPQNRNEINEEDDDNGDIRSVDETFVEDDGDDTIGYDDKLPDGKTIATFSFTNPYDNNNDNDDSGGEAKTNV